MPAQQTRMPKDADAMAIQSLSLSSSEVAVGDVAGTSARIQLPINADVIEVACLTDCHINFGDNTVVASTSNSIFPRGTAVYKVDQSSQTYVAFILAAGATGAKISVTRLK